MIQTKTLIEYCTNFQKADQAWRFHHKQATCGTQFLTKGISSRLLIIIIIILLAILLKLGNLNKITYSTILFTQH